MESITKKHTFTLNRPIDSIVVNMNDIEPSMVEGIRVYFPDSGYRLSADDIADAVCNAHRMAHMEDAEGRIDRVALTVTAKHGARVFALTIEQLTRMALEYHRHSKPWGPSHEEGRTTLDKLYNTIMFHRHGAKFDVKQPWYN